MASSSGKLTYAQRLERRTHQDNYHHIEVCGSSFHGLATTLEGFATKNEIANGLAQIDRCITARRREIERRDKPDPIHNDAIEQLIALHRAYARLMYKDPEILKKAMIRYSDKDHRFEVGRSLAGEFAEFTAGGGKKTRKARRRKARKTRRI